MISFNKKDLNVRKIAQVSKLDGLITSNFYRVFGITGTERPLIEIDCEYSPSSDAKMKQLRIFFDAVKIKSSFNITYCYQKFEFIKIGFKSQLRKDVDLSSKLLQTIIYFMEGRLDLNMDSKCMNEIKRKVGGLSAV